MIERIGGDVVGEQVAERLGGVRLGRGLGPSQRLGDLTLDVGVQRGFGGLVEQAAIE